MPKPAIIGWSHGKFGRSESPLPVMMADVARDAIAAGRHKVSLVIGVERMAQVSGHEVNEVLLSANYRMGKPSEIAEAVAYLASDGAAFATAQILRIDGGAVMP